MSGEGWGEGWGEDWGEGWMRSELYRAALIGTKP